MRMYRLYAPLIPLLVLASLALAACGLPALAPPAAGEELRSNRRRAVVQAPASDLAALTAGNTAFGLDLYHTLAQQEGNLFFSPHSISLALALTFAGAASTTAEQMRSTLHFTLPDDQLHAAFNTLDAALARPRGTHDEPGFTLRQANALWGQQDYTFRPAFLDLLAANYGVGLRVLDFKAAPEPARAQINAWVRAQTEDKIPELLPEQAVTVDTRLVLTNAIYFKAKWQSPFDPAATADGPFTLADGTRVTTPMMRQTTTFGYTAGADYQALQLDYLGDAAMIVLLPAADGFAAFEAGLTAERLQEIVGGLAPQRVFVMLPKLDYTSPTVELRPVLEALGMRDALVPGQADFSGMDGTRALFIGGVHHRAALIVDEVGTEAAAATSVESMAEEGATAPPPVEMRVDHPFLLLIRDNHTGALLFVGRIVDPRS